MENEFYEFALEQFQFVRAHAVREKDGELYVLAQSFFYEKIYPKVNWTRLHSDSVRSQIHWWWMLLSLFLFSSLGFKAGPC